MHWVAIDVNIAGDAITHRLADAFRLRIAEAAGLLALTFAGMAQHAQDGNLELITNSQIEEWARWHGKRGAFATFFRAQLADEDQQVRAWEKYNGAAIRELKASRDRSRAWRDARRAERLANAAGTALRTPFGTRTEPVANGSTGQDITRPDKQHKSKSGGADAPPPWATSLRARWLARVGHISLPAVQRELGGSVAVHGEEAVLAAIDAYADARLAAGKPLKLEWFAAEVVSYIRRAEEDEQPIVEDGWLTGHGDKVTR